MYWLFLYFILFVLAIPIVEENTHVIDIEYSPLVGGFGITLNDGRAAFLTSTTLKFDPNVRFPIKNNRFINFVFYFYLSFIVLFKFDFLLFNLIFVQFWIEPNLSKVRLCYFVLCIILELGVIGSTVPITLFVYARYKIYRS